MALQFKKLQQKDELFVLRNLHEKETTANAHLKKKGQKAHGAEEKHDKPKQKEEEKPKDAKKDAKKPSANPVAAAPAASKAVFKKPVAEEAKENVFPESLPVEVEEVVAEDDESKGLGQEIGTQADHVRDLKASAAPKAEIDQAVRTLLAMKEKMKGLESKQRAVQDKAAAHRHGVEDLCLRKFVYVPAYEIYGGVAGLFDYGPPGAAIFQNIVSAWRSHFVLHEEMLEIVCPSMTPEIVLKTSGHVDRFTDFMVRDKVTNECYRADKLVEEHLERLLEDPGLSEDKKRLLQADRTAAGAMGAEDLKRVIQKYNIRTPEKNEVTDPFPFNLMFQTQIGPSGKLTGYLRPETAQGIFVNFKRLLEYNAGKMPFASAQIGSAFRNEIAPRAGLLRVREFTLAEIEHFVDPNNKLHPRYQSIAALKVNLLAREDQKGADIARQMSFGDAVDKGVINNQTLAYFMARTWLFLVGIGIRSERLRFRQHKATEMAHYAADCWDAEIKSSYGWIECVGIADRACYDLTVHANRSGVEMMAQEALPEPVTTREPKVTLNKGKLGQKLKGDMPTVSRYLETLPAQQMLVLQADLAKGPVTIKVEGKPFTIDSEVVSVQIVEKKTSVRRYTPSVIEPSFGLGRILYSLLEHAFHYRAGGEAEKRAVLRLPPSIAPTKVSILPISSGDHFDRVAAQLGRDFLVYNLPSKSDFSGVSIGKKYARADELGIPFGITIDFETGTDLSVTLRERDSCDQVRIKVDEVADVVARLCAGVMTWKQVLGAYPKFLIHDDEAEVEA